LNLAHHRARILSVAGEDFDPHRATLGVAQQTHHHLLMAFLAIPVIAKDHDVAIRIGSFEVSAGDVVKDQVPVLEMLASQGALNHPLALEQPVHRQITVRLDSDGALDTAQLPQGRVLPLVGQGQLAARVDDSSDNHG